MPSIADIYVTLLPETSRISDGIVRAFREVDPKAAEAGRRWGQEIQRGLGEARVELKADTAKAKAELDEASKKRDTKIEADADTAKAEAQIDAAARDRKATIEVDADTLVSSVQRSVSQAAPAMAGVGTQLGQSLASAGAQAAPQVGGSLSSAMGPVGTAMAAALIAGGVTAAAGIAASLSGAIGLIPAGLGGGIGVIGTLVTGLDGVKDAWDAAGKAADSSGKDQEEKAKSVAAAQRSLKDAVLDEANAQKDVANARKDARQQLEDLNVQLRGGVIDEKQAILDAQAARRDLATGRYKDSIDYEQAVLRVQAADQRVLEAHTRNVELQGKANDANAKGVEGSDQVVAANQRLAKAQESVAVAMQNVAAAQAKSSSNADAFATAMGKLSPNAQAFINTLQGLKPAWDAVKFAVQDSLFAGIGPELQRLATQYLPVLKDAMSGLAGTMNSAFKDIGAWLSKPETMAQIKEIVANIGSSFAEWAKSLVPFSEAFLTITKVGSGFLPQLGTVITEGANAFNNFIQQAAKSGELQQWMRTGIQAMGELIKLFPVLGKMFLDLAPIGIPVLQTLGILLRALEPLFRVLGVAGAQYQTGINQFWGAMGRLADKFSEIVKVVWPPLQTVLHTMEQTFQRVFGTVANVVEKAWKIIKPVFDGINVGGVNLRSMLDMVSKLPGMSGFAPPPIAGTPTMPGVTPAAGGDGASLPSLSSMRGQGLTMPFLGGPLPKRSEMSGHAPRPWLLNDPDNPNPLPTAAPSAAAGGDSHSLLASALRAKGFSPAMIRLIEGFSKVEGNNPSGVPTLGFTDAQLGGKSDLQSHVDALAKQFKDRASVAGPFPEGGTDQQQAQWIAKVVGQSGLASDWQGNAQPKDYVARVVAAMQGTPGVAPGTPALPSAPSTGGGTPVFVTNWPAGGGIPAMASGVPGVAASAPSAVAGAGDGALLANVPAGRYLQTQAADLTKGIGDCSSAVEDLINMLDGVSTAGRQMSTHNADQWLRAHGFMPTSTPMPGTFQVGFNPDHMQATLPGGTNFNWGSDAAAGNRGIGGTGAWDPAFTSHYYRPAGAGGGGAFPSAGMPTAAAPQGVSPEGIPLGTQQSPYYVIPAQGSSGGQQLGQDFVSGIMEIFGIDGSVFKNPMDTGLFKGFKGLMKFLTGGSGGKQGLPASAFGGDGASLPGLPTIGGGGGAPGG
uniref:phage tail protein n=1 Tax=Mycobacterium intracellulare TaxID=1767 RepID=UPI003F718DA2